MSVLSKHLRRSLSMIQVDLGLPGPFFPIESPREFGLTGSPADSGL